MKPGSKGGKLSGKASRPRTITRSKAKHAGLILSAIDQLRKRKARPDLSRICHLVQRQHKLAIEQTRAELDTLVSEQLVVVVDYRDRVSYRNVPKWQKLLHGKVTGNERTAVIAGNCNRRNKTGRRVLKAVKNLIRQVGNGLIEQGQLSSSRSGISAVDVVVSEVNGVTLNQIHSWISEKWGTDAADSMEAVKIAATAEVNRGHLVELTDGSYTLNKEVVDMSASEQTQKRGPGRPKNEDKLRGLAGKSAAVTEFSVTVNNSSTVSDSSAVSASSARSSSQKKFGGKRKPKLRKSVDQEVESAKKSRSDEAEMSLSTETGVMPSTAADSDAVKCSYCQSSTNRRGNTEDLLVCKDCHANIHPSCMDLSEDLARRAARSPWQCIDCKTCNVCDDSGYADEMLFCDACDKGYHMNCHKPPVLEKPTDTDKWVCCRCVAELEANSAQPTEDPPVAVATNSDSKVDDCGETSCLPTPNDSPVHFKEEVVPKDMSPAAANSDAVVTLPKLSTTLVGETPDASDWSVADVAKYFTDIGFVEQAETFQTEEIDGKALLLMTRSDVLTGMSFRLGPALKIYAHVQRLQTRGIGLFH